MHADRIVTNIASLAGDDAVTSLCQWLYDYAAFALFAAASLVPKEQEQILSRQVGELLSPLHQQHDDQPMSSIMPSQVTITIYYVSRSARSRAVAASTSLQRVQLHFLTEIFDRISPSVPKPRVPRSGPFVRSAFA